MQYAIFILENPTCHSKQESVTYLLPTKAIMAMPIFSDFFAKVYLYLYIHIIT